MKTILITSIDELSVSFWRNDTAESVAHGDDDPLAGVAIHNGLISWDWMGKSGAKSFDGLFDDDD